MKCKNLNKGVVSVALFSLLCYPAFAQEDSEQNKLLLPEDLTIKETDKYQAQELRVGGRLERVTVHWKNGITEVYQNERSDSLWYSDETELGAVQNVRQWRIGSW